MGKFLKDKNYFFCFSPEVMLATFLIEIILAVYVFFRYKMGFFGKIVVSLLVLLAAFQLAEYKICTGYNGIVWSKIGFVVITLLPVLGLHLISFIAKRKHFLTLGYALVTTYILIFIFAPKGITGATCGGNYIIFQTAQELSWTYTIYYFGFLLLGIWQALEGIRNNNNDADNSDKKLLWWMIAGYTSFMLPMAIVAAVAPLVAWNATPSIMCGFALALALVLAFKVAPIYSKK